MRVLTTALWMGLAATAIALPGTSAAESDDDSKVSEAGAGYAIRSDDFQHGKKLPNFATCDGEGKSPALSWSAPRESHPKSYAIIVEDPDAPRGTYTHMVLFDIPVQTTSLPRGAGGVGVFGANSTQKTGYAPACPPKDGGPHRYFFRLYALDTDSLGIRPGASRATVDAAMRPHVVGEAELIGKYERKSQPISRR